AQKAYTDSSVAAEAAARQAADVTLTTKINGEITRATAAETGLSTSVGTLTTTVNGLSSSVTSLTSTVNGLSTTVGGLASSLSSETARATAAENLVQTNLNAEA